MSSEPRRIDPTPQRCNVLTNSFVSTSVTLDPASDSVSAQEISTQGVSLLESLQGVQSVEADSAVTTQ